MIEIQEKGAEALQRKFTKLASGLSDRRDVNRRASIELYGWIIRNYDREGADNGGWAPLAPSTIRRKQNAGKEKMLVWSGRLRNSFTSFYDNDQAGVGTNVPYSEFHEDGTSRMPQRRMLPDRETALGIGINVYGHFIETERRKADL